MFGVAAAKKAMSGMTLTFRTCHKQFANITTTKVGTQTLTEVVMPMEDTYQMFVDRLQKDGHI